MKREKINKIPFAEKKILVHQACLMFRKLAKTSEFLKYSSFLKDREQQIDKPNSIFELILQLLSPDQAIIIKNDFIEPKKSQWYLDLWSKTTYYKIKHAAINEFLFLLYG